MSDRGVTWAGTEPRSPEYIVKALPGEPPRCTAENCLRETI